MSKASRNRAEEPDIATQNFNAGYKAVHGHPLFAPLAMNASIVREARRRYPENGLCFVSRDGTVACNPKVRANPDQWARALAHSLLHLGMGHFVRHSRQEIWNAVCDCAVERFLDELKFGTPIYGEGLAASALPAIAGDEEKLYGRLCASQDAKAYIGFGGFGTAGNAPNMLAEDDDDDRWIHYSSRHDWSKLFAQGLAGAVRSAVRVASGQQASIGLGSDGPTDSAASRARQWFISSYPLLGAIAAGFRLVEDPQVCQRMHVSIAAVCPALSEIYMNPAWLLSGMEMRFVMAHEFLHAALRHDARQEWRDAYLWNVACDFVINQWLTEMGVGERPDGLLYDEQFAGMNAEAIYDTIVTDMRTCRKLATLRGVGLGDILPGPARMSSDVDLDAFYRSALSQGLSYHQEQGRGYLPVGMIEEIRALSHPPIPWDVDLARWFDEQFAMAEKTRTYARPSRRQSSTQDIPRPNRVHSQFSLDGRTYGVVLDTSGSMDRGLLASALGAVASYNAARDVAGVRVVFCDAQAYDMGYMKPEDIAGTVKVRGRGGTVLQPGIDLLLEAEDFPKDAPILVITDGYCDKVMLYGREHAFLVPAGANLPFVPKGKVFRLR